MKNKEDNREVIKNVLRDYTQQKEVLRNRGNKVNHLEEIGETPSMFNDIKVYIVYVDTKRLIRQIVRHKGRKIQEIIDELKDLYNGELESRLDVYLSKKQMEELGVDELDHEWTPDKTKISYTTPSNQTLFGYYNSLGYHLPNDQIKDYKKILSKLDIDDTDNEDTDIEGIPDLEMVKSTLQIYIPLLSRLLLGKKPDLTWDEMVRQKKWSDFEL